MKKQYCRNWKKKEESGAGNWDELVWTWCWVSWNKIENSCPWTQIYHINFVTISQTAVRLCWYKSPLASKSGCWRTPLWPVSATGLQWKAFLPESIFKERERWSCRGIKDTGKAGGVGWKKSFIVVSCSQRESKHWCLSRIAGWLCSHSVGPAEHQMGWSLH